MTNSRYYRKLTESLGLEHTTDLVSEKNRMTIANFYMLLNKTAQMFDYDGLPPTLPRLALERMLQTEGAVVIWKVPSTYIPVGFGPSFNPSSELTANMLAPFDSHIPLYAFSCNFAEAPDPYGEPFRVVVTDVGFTPSISETLTINTDCVVGRSDTHMRGLRSLHAKYAALLTEAEISLRSTLVTLRDQLTFIAKTETQRKAISAYISSREVGEYATILAPDLGSPLEAIKPDGQTNSVELAVNGRQAIYAAWYNEIGLNPSFSLKREYTSAQEIDTNTDLLMPTIDDMFWCRKRMCDDINALFGTSISVRKASAWEMKERLSTAAVELEEAQAETTANMLAQSPDSTDKGGDEDDSDSKSE